MRRLAIAALSILAFAAGPVAEAKTLRWASQGDILTFDPMPRTRASTTRGAYVYDALVLQQAVRARACAGDVVDARRKPLWRFNLRKDVKFHDGTPFTADDVVFSFERALAAASNMQFYAQGMQGAKQDRRLHGRDRHRRHRTRCCCGSWSTSRS